MSEESWPIDAAEFLGEGELSGEQSPATPASLAREDSRFLTREEASKCLRTLGKCDSGLRYSYLTLDACDLGLTDIGIVPTFRNVVFVNVSGNRLTLKALRVLASMTYLLMLQADRNLLDSARLEPMPYLQVLALNRNGIADTAGISHRLLECLELSYNGISALDLNPYALENLRVLELRGNALTTTNGIFLPALARLYLAENEIGRIEGLETLVNLSTLHLRDNVISSLDGFDPRCAELRYLNLRKNRIGDLSELKKLRGLPRLRVLVLSQNPAVSVVGAAEEDGEGDDDDDDSSYRVRVLAMLPNLERLDKDSITNEERDAAAELRRRISEEDGTGFTEITRDAARHE